jgi:hypothetical protein
MGRRQRSTRSAALELGWTETYLGRRLSGAIPFNVAELAALANLLEIPVTAFFQGPEHGTISLRIQTPAPGSAAAA